MVNYWITLSNYYQGPKTENEVSAKEREDQQWWWYKRGRDTPKEHDKVIIYQPGNTKVARKYGVKIKDKHQYRFIGNFTVEDVDPNSYKLRPREKGFLWKESEFVDIRPLLNDLVCTSKNIRKWGKWSLTFLNKAWVEISRQDYDLILSRK
ncbi:hypothetical protein BMS3Bbin16_00717 [archaeon BMS3Bbin16]|nr:hypothetical protein BMS3Bbin16_00717 [archaeon BMS3Bbin16]